MSERSHFDAGAAGYDRRFGSVSVQFIAALLRAARLGISQRMLDVATGTEVAAQAVAAIVGPSGYVVAIDILAPILEQTRVRLVGVGNASCAIEGGTTLSFSERSFDAVLCSMGLILFPDPVRVGGKRCLGRPD